MALVAATGVLAATTAVLALATRVLARIERRRERAETRERARERLRRKLELAGKLAKVSWDDSIAPDLKNGHLPTVATYILDLEPLVDFERDQLLPEDFGPLRQAFDSVSARGTRYPEKPQRDLKERFERIQERLARDVPRWRKKLLELRGAGVGG